MNTNTLSDRLEGSALPINRLGLPETVCLRDGQLYLLDQTVLPHEVVAVRQTSVRQVFDSIQRLVVRGAPAIGIAAAYGMLVDLEDFQNASPDTFDDEIRRRGQYLRTSRPTAVNLMWAIDRMLDGLNQPVESSGQRIEQLSSLAAEIHREDRELCRRIGMAGQDLIPAGGGVLTHCNAGSLATSEFGTATSPMYVAHQAGVQFKVWVDETRPLLQGGRLTAWELHRCGIDARLITDNMSASIMASGQVDLVIVGADRVAMNGDFANKIGTLGVAILARHFGIPLYVAVPYSTLDRQLADGSAIPIEQRDASEVRGYRDCQWAPADVAVANPAFDVTPGGLVAGFITENGIVQPPFDV
ncbi:MAG: S-methyl-5-thioribose-1-phosphate isomerase [Planctomycetota bacterium]